MSVIQSKWLVPGLIGLALLILTVLYFFLPKGQYHRNAVNTELAPAPIGPYSQAVKAGDLVFVSGQIALDPITGALDTSNIRSEATLTFRNIGAVLAAAGSGWDRVVKTTLYLTDLSDFATVNEVYAGFTGPLPPARETVQVCSLPKGVHIEVSVVAVR